MTTRLATAALVATLLAASPARAQTPTAGSYLIARLGAFSPRRTDLEGFGTGFDGELGLGYRFAQNFAVEGAGGYYRSPQVTTHDPVNGLIVPAEGTLSVVPLTGTLRAILPLGRAEISALAGLGLYFASMHDTRAVSVLSSSGPDAPTSLVTVPISSSDTTLGVHVGAGFGVHVTPQVLLGADLRYVIVSAKFFDTTTHIDGLRLDAVIGYRF